MRGYELVIILSPKDSAEERKKLLEKIKEEVEKAKGKVEKTEEWGRKDFSNLIKKKNEGIYFFLNLSFPPKEVANFEKKLKLEERILRYLLVRKEERKGVKKRQVARKH